MKILVVDDEELLVKGIRFNLQNDGYQVVTGSNGREAIELARDPDIRLIVLDVMMPEIDGLTACRTIREFSDVSGKSICIPDPISIGATSIGAT